LHVVKQVHNEFMGGLDVIMKGDFYQTPPIWDSWIFKPKIKGYNILGIKFGTKMLNVMNYNRSCDKMMSILSIF
jgi:hypothetical protein